MENLKNDSPLKRGLDPPSYGTFSTPQVSVFCFSCTKILDRADQKKHFRESAFSGTFSSPSYVLHPPYHGPIGSPALCHLTSRPPLVLCQAPWAFQKGVIVWLSVPNESARNKGKQQKDCNSTCRAGWPGGRALWLDSEFTRLWGRKSSLKM